MDREETWTLYLKGKEEWNAWSRKLLEEKQELQEAGQWAVERNSVGELEPKNEVTQDWFARARADFSGRIFEQRVDFSGFVFPGEADFVPWEYKEEDGKSRKQPVVFRRDAVFEGAEFVGNAWFQEVEFAEGARFERTKFIGDASFLTARFRGIALFWDAEFLGFAIFAAAHVESGLSLQGTRFHRLPDFRQAHFRRAPGLDRLRLARSVEPGGLLRSIFFRTSPATSAKYRALKALAVAGHDHEQTQVFFRGELRARRGHADRPWHWRYWLGLFYEIFSDFGRSLFRPLLGWGLSVVGFARLYFAHHVILAMAAGKPAGQCLAGSGAPWLSALYLSLKKSLLSLGWEQSEKINQTYACLYGVDTGYRAARKGSELVPVIPDMVAFLAIPQTLLAAVFLFLFALALRNAFRL